MKPPGNSDFTPAQDAMVKRAGVAADFAAVFGVAGSRSEAQAAVWKVLLAWTGETGNAFRFGESQSERFRDGFKVALEAAHRDGARSVLQLVRRQLQIASDSTT